MSKGLLCNDTADAHSWSSASDEEPNMDEWWDPLSETTEKTMSASQQSADETTSSDAADQLSKQNSEGSDVNHRNWSFQCVQRVKRDMMAIYHDPSPGIFVMQDDQDLTVIHALITGSFDTPYEGGFFYFIVRCPPEYPIKPPKVKFMTTGGGRVRLNPNLYKNGKVCISILGTWSGPAWSPAHTISSVLISIQSLLTEKPYHNEPGFERERCPGDSKRYNEIIQHETIRVAVCGMLDNDYSLAMPPPLVQAMNQSFLQFYELYETVLSKNLNFTGCTMQDPFGEQRGKFEYKTLLERIQQIKNRLQETEKADSIRSSSPDSD